MNFKNIVKILALRALNQMFLFKNDYTVFLFLNTWFHGSDNQLQAVLAKYLPLLTHFIMR